MRLQNLMENKQLDFNQPFLSVRRFSSMETSLKPNGIAKSDNPRPSLPVYKSELKSGPVRNPGNVPFLWEQAPGRPKNERKPLSMDSEGHSITPKLPPGMSSSSKQPHCGEASPSSDNFPSNNKSVKSETLKEKIERGSNSSSEDGDETYLEANDTLSRTDSVFMNCSVTGLSGLDGADAKPSGTFLTDPQTRDFMMGRFLPAAMAMASETPQVAYRKQSVQREQQREAKKVVDVEQPLIPQARKLSYYAPNKSEDKREDEANDLDVSEFPSAKACGLVARFCLRGSFCLLNPVPSMRMRGPPVSSAHRVENDNLIDDSCSTRKNLKDAANGEKCSHGNQMLELLHEEKIVLRGQSNKISQQSPEKFKNSKVHSDRHRTGRSKFRELLSNESCSQSPAIEKTLYVDSVHNVNNRSSNSTSSDSKGMTDCTMDDDSYKEIFGLDSSTQNKRLMSKSVESVESSFLSCSGRSNYDAKLDLNASSLEQDLIQNLQNVAISKEKFHLESKVTENSKTRDQSKIDLESNLHKRIHDPDGLLPISSQHPLAPPLPKSPSESWLKRTLPTVSAKNLIPRSTLAARICTSRQNTVF